MNRKRILEIIEKYGWDIPAKLTDSLKESVNYLNFPFHLIRWKNGFADNRVEIYWVIVNETSQKLVRETWSRGSRSMDWGHGGDRKVFPLSHIPQLLLSGYHWGKTDFLL